MELQEFVKYKYTRLPGKTSLRLLRLCADASHVETVTCELATVRFDEEPEFEALSWCWGKKPKEGWDKTLRIRQDGRIFQVKISKNLYDALRALRKTDEDRSLWVDAICINQGDTKERNEQVPQMDQIYGKAKNTCVWLGEEDNTSDAAFDFISSSILKLWDFDRLCENQEEIKKWEALLNLMRRDWFSRRWVVQEIALSMKAEIYCGSRSILWQDFADAVSLFVEFESQTHRLSEKMKRDETYNHVPDFFGNVDHLGAALLVEATSNLFRNRVDVKPIADRDAKRLSREPLSSLEYLVSRLTVFKASEPRDTIYALLALAKDTTLQSHASDENEIRDVSTKAQKRARDRLKRSFNKTFAMEHYKVDYDLPIRDVYERFVRFSIERAHPVRALDIICRPWAPEIKGDEPSIAATGEPQAKRSSELPSWMPTLRGASFNMHRHVRKNLGGRMVRCNADPLVGMPEPQDRIYSAAGTTRLVKSALRFKRRRTYCSIFMKGFVLEKVDRVFEISRLGNIPRGWTQAVDWNFSKEDSPEAFWRTLVADRGPKGSNPPTYYPRACKDVMDQMGEQDILDSGYLIDNCLSTIIAQFLRRVQAVIWNRHLIETEKGRLGLAPPNVSQKAVICIFYGCSVPVVLERVEKTPEDITAEAEEEEEALVEMKRSVIKRMRDRVRKRKEQESGKHQQDVPNPPKSLPKSKDERPTAPTIWWYKDEVFPCVFLLYTALSYFCGYFWVLELFSRHGANFPIMRQTQTQQQKGALISQQQESARLLRTFVDYQIATHFVYLFGLWRTLRCLGKVLVRPMHWTSQQLRAKTSKAHSLVAVLLYVWRPLTLANFQYVIRVLTRRNTPKEYYWRLIGECYVHGMMDGEAMKLQHTEDIRPEVFEIR